MEDSHVYKEQLRQIQLALESCQNETERTELQSLKTNIIELLSLTNDGENEENDGNSQEFKRPSVSQSNSMDDEFATFMAEMAKEGAVPSQTSFNVDKFKSFEGMKCRAPHKHQWGDTAYHNAMICSILEDNSKNEENFEVKVLFTNPTHQEMLPCPYFFNSDCKFTEDKCRFSHGEIVQFSDLQDYVEPNFELLTIGSKVLAKKDNNLWYRAAVRRIYDEKCLVKFESQQKDVEVVFEHVFPLGDNGKSESDDDEQSDLEENIDIINTSLIITPGSQALGEWEKYTKGIGSKLMQKMGYVVGTGLGKRAEGRIDPVTAVILPAGKSLDHCMKLRENAGGDKDLFSVEKKLKRMQKQQEKRNQKAYEREQNKVDVFNFLNKTLLPVNSAGKCEQQQCSKKEQREKMKKETNRNLNVASLQIDENIRRAEREIEKICESLKRHRDGESQVRKSLKEKLEVKINEVNQLKTQLLVIKNEQSNRSDKRKLTVF